MCEMHLVHYNRAILKTDIPHYTAEPDPMMYLALKMTVLAHGRDFDKAKAEDTFADIAQMLKQKTAGQGRNKKDIPFENWERLMIEGLCHAVSLYLSGRLDGLEKNREDDNKNESKSNN